MKQMVLPMFQKLWMELKPHPPEQLSWAGLESGGTRMKTCVGCMFLVPCSICVADIDMGPYRFLLFRRVRRSVHVMCWTVQNL